MSQFPSYDYLIDTTFVGQLDEGRKRGEPWRDILVDHRVDDDPDPVARLDEMVARSARYHRLVTAFEAALDGDATAAAHQVEGLAVQDPGKEPGPGAGHRAAAGVAAQADPPAGP